MSGMQSNLEKKVLEWILLNKKRPKLFNVSPEMKVLDREILLKHSVKWHFRRGFQKRYRSCKGEKLGQKRRMLMGFHEYHPRHDTGLGSCIFPTALKFIKASSSPSKKIAPIDLKFQKSSVKS